MYVWIGKSWTNSAVYHAYENLLRSYKCIELIKFKTGYGVLNLIKVMVALIFGDRKNEIIAHSPLSALLLSSIGYRTILWFQGVGSHESYLRNKSKLRFYILWFLEMLSISFAGKIIFVSDFMRDFYIKIYPWCEIKSEVKYCTSDLCYDENIEKIPNSFCYVGGCSKWQNIGKMLDLFVELKNMNSARHLYIATNDVIQIRDMLREKNIDSEQGLTVCTIRDRGEMQRFLSAMEMGFLLRDDILINNVSSPIKLAEYLSCDINVITTSALTSFVDELNATKAGYILDKLESLDFICYRRNVSKKLYEDKFMTGS